MTRAVRDFSQWWARLNRDAHARVLARQAQERRTRHDLRAELDIVTRPVGELPRPVDGAHVIIGRRDGADELGLPGLATIYAGPTGDERRLQPLTTGPDGRVDGWVEPGRYLVTVSAPGRATVSERVTIPS